MSENRKTGLSRRDMLKTIAGGTGAVALGALPVASVAAQDPVTITYWHGWTEQWENYVQDIVDAFHAHQDAIRVEPLVVPYADFLVRLTAAIASGNPPDIVTFFGSNEIPGLAALGGITPYADLGPPEEVAAFQDFLTPAAWAGGVVDGTLYGTPSGFGVYDLAWNKDHFEEVGLDPEVGPSSIEELDEMAELLTVEDADGNLDRMGLLHLGFGGGGFPRAWFGNFGGQLYDAENDIITANHPGNVRALEWMMSYSEKYGVERLQRFQSGLSGERGGTQDPFIAGRLSMHLIGPWKLGDFHRFAADGFRWGITHLPPVAGEEDSTGWGSWIWGNYQCIPSGASNPAAAYEFAKWWSGFTDPDVMAIVAAWKDTPTTTTGSLAALEVERIAALFDDHPDYRSFFETMGSPRALTTPMIPVANFYTDRLGSEVSQALRLEKSAQEALDAVQTAVENEYRQF
ncbi:MAG: extracellular solute-binding protein [Chloroflexota bacterium]|nr:extracellular solute-binding protein [Chloroflexota bacterium]MDE2947140.1 extracellular solute-binding protein [Chloroflexota bacterium]